MTQEEIKTQDTAASQEEQQSYAVRPNRERHRIAFSKRDSMFGVRNTLNILFMLLAIIGLVMWNTMDSHTAAIIVLLVGVAFKFAEVCIRLFHK